MVKEQKILAALRLLEKGNLSFQASLERYGLKTSSIMKYYHFLYMTGILRSKCNRQIKKYYRLERDRAKPALTAYERKIKRLERDALMFEYYKTGKYSIDQLSLIFQCNIQDVETTIEAVLMPAKYSFVKQSKINFM